MGDRVTVTITVPNCYAEAVIANEGVPAGEWPNADQSTSSLTYYQCKYGELAVTKALEEQCIPYTLEWEEGSEFEAGSAHNRYTKEGRRVYQSFYKSEEAIDVHMLMGYVTNPNPIGSLEELIRNVYNNITPLPWDNQVEYGKLARAIKLLDPTGSTQEA